MILKRIFFTFFLVTSILSFPYWLYLPMIMLGVFLFPFYIESVIFGLFIDIYYGNLMHIWGMPIPMYALLMALLILLIPAVKSRLRFNA